ncbi:MAG: hypothetical protein PHP54_02295 [Clostridia bacterium]|nr:hypothetical protein [Clostridia bacterium]
MKANKKGISLIVLVITIIVIIILAAAVILTLNNNNPINNATDAVFKSDSAEITSALAIYIGNYMAKNNGVSPFSTTTAPAVEIEIGTPRTIDQVKGDVPQDKLNWSDIGLSGMPGSMKKATVNSITGKVTCTKK